ncbi:nucleoside monophosphate kinase [Mesorhizobium sp.]|uniref:nucleoside monophosphate kinase n=1 Tax=Mesorhizobium sp. TaxID=1871066 RepID=UPI000FE7341F|nr:nucleoside monophosphate kinase [Mesorhizobium sp.]RWC53040.1 MAG: hypothetical protein EOS56_31235 [Mesorhizobium sp.]RWC53568.1 MAG: hypothetical protein EOS29_29635 [Mesorhizobium sp.]
MLVSLFGRPGAGKSFVGDWLEQTHGFDHLALGRLLKQPAILREIGIDPYEMAKAIESGRTITNVRLYSWLYDGIMTSRAPVVVDGYPRAANSIEPFKRLVEALPVTRRVIALNLLAPPDVTAVRIGARGRDDDTIARLADRNDEYERIQRPLLDTLPARAERLDINACGTRDEVLTAVAQALGLASQRWGEQAAGLAL